MPTKLQNPNKSEQLKIGDRFSIGKSSLPGFVRTMFASYLS